MSSSTESVADINYVAFILVIYLFYILNFFRSNVRVFCYIFSTNNIARGRDGYKTVVSKKTVSSV
jgi:hypothetical protein